MNRYNYAKLQDGKLQYPPKEFIEDGKRIVGFTEDFLLERGYKPIKQSEYPQECVDDSEMNYEPVYTETEDSIAVSWKLAEHE